MARALLPGPGAPGAEDTLVARTQSGELVAYAEARRVGDEVHVLAIAVLPAWRRRGIASALLGAVRGGARAAYLGVRESNSAGLGFYARHGFEVAGRRRGYYADGEDALLMTWAAA
jgi:ribosomal-protein-alanine N-acetyltransferase